MVSTLEQMQVPNETGPGVRRSKRPLLASASGLLARLFSKTGFCSSFFHQNGVFGLSALVALTALGALMALVGLMAHVGVSTFVASVLSLFTL